MARIKIGIILIFLILGIQSASAQVYKFQTTGFSVLEKNAKGKWGKWSDLQKAAIIISLDTSKNRIVVYSQEIQLYNIIKYRPNEENDNDLIYAFDCTDEDGQDFTISIITRKKQNNRKQLYINQKDVIVVYNIINFVE
ncbi:MAG TPA: hypothetical protein VK623_01825 [Flavobacterium sp.]|nr:hypothetical protein [Flavobacterium sp.]